MKGNLRVMFLFLGQLMLLLTILIAVGCEAPVSVASSMTELSKAVRGEWAPNVAYVTGDTVTYMGTTYTCLQSHTSLVGWVPPKVAALWLAGGSTSTPTPSVTPTPTPTSNVTVFYVATTGSDSNSGTLSSPFRTVNKGLSVAKAGNTVYVRGGTYREKVVFPNSGTNGSPIKLSEYPGETAIIDGTGLTVSGKEALVTINSKSYIVVDGFDICNYVTSASWVEVNGIVISGTSDYVTVQNCNVFNITNNASIANGRSAHGILIIGDQTDPITNILVTHCTVHDCHTGTSESFTINGYVDGFTITSNSVYNNDNIGIDAAGGYAANSTPAFNYARNGVISYNYVLDCRNELGLPAGNFGAIGIYVDGARNITIEGNWVEHCDRGVGAVSETNNFPTDNVNIRNNAVYNCKRTGIYIGGYIGYTTGGTSNCKIINNTLFNNDEVLGAYGEIEGEISIRENCTNNLIKNNIVYGRSDNTDIYIRKYTGSGSGNSINYNMYYKSSGTTNWMWNGTNYTNFSSWKAASGGDTNSNNGTNPLFVSLSPLNLHLQTASPAKNTGNNDANAGSLDVDGQTRTVGTIDKGADELQ